MLFFSETNFFQDRFFKTYFQQSFSMKKEKEMPANKIEGNQ